MRTVLVCGGRTFGFMWNDATLQWVADPVARLLLGVTLTNLHVIHGFDQLIHGAASGADTLAEHWAVMNGIPVCPYTAEWQKLGKRAGFVRNERMLVEGQPSLVVAFEGKVGTKMMIDIARKASVEVVTPGWSY